MDEMLAKLLVPNSNTTHDERRNELYEAFKNPEVVPALCDVIVTSSNPEIRQSATVLLREQLTERRKWNKLSVVIRNRIKQDMLQALVNEQEKSVKYAIAKFIGFIGKDELPENSWPEVLQFIHTLCSSDTTVDKEMGLYSLSIMTQKSNSSHIVQAESFAMLFTNILGGISQPISNLAYFSVRTMKNFVPIISGHQQIINVYHQLLPRVIEIIMAFLSEDEKKACDLFEILEELKEFAIAVIAPHVKLIVDMCLQIGSNSSISTNVQIKAILLLLGIIRSKGKVVQKNKLVEPIIDVLIHLMAQDDEGNEEYFLWEPYQSTSINAATVTLNQIALHIPAEKVVPYLWTKVEPAIQGGDIYAQQAAYLSLAALAEGCPKHITRTKYLEPFLKCVCTAIPNPNTVLRNAALFALGKFAIHLQPEISQYASEVLPVLFDCLAEVLQQMEVEKKDHPSLDRLFYAIEMFCKNLEEGLMPYLPTLMERLFLALDPDGFSIQLKCVSLRMLGAAATAVKQGILPYFDRIIGMLNLYSISAIDDLDPEEQQSHCYAIAIAIESLAVVAQFVGAENFNPLAVETLQRGLRILEMIIGPDVTKSVYALFAALAIVMKEELGPELPRIVNKMIVTIQYRNREKEEWPKILNSLQDRIKIHLYLDFDEKNWGKEFESFSSAIENPTMCHAYSMETSCNKATIQAYLALGEICLNTGKEFLPFVEKSLEEIFKLVDYPNNTIRRASVKALQQFCIALYKVNTTESKQALYKALQKFVPKCSELIRTDKERWVVMNCLDTYASLLDEIKGDFFVGEGHREAIMNCVVDVLTLKTMCQDTDFGTNDNDTENNEDDAEAEQDELLLKSAGDVIPKFAAAITPDDFACYFPNVLELLSSRTVKQNSISQRTFAYGILADCMKSLDVSVEEFVPQLLKMWLTGARDAAEEVRKNSIFGLGEMILHGKDRIFSHYNEILQALPQAVVKETHAGTLDNICGALAKMTLVNPGGIPLDQVNQNSISQRSFDYGALAECMKSLDVSVEKFVPQLLKMWLTGARDAAEEVRKISIFGLGEMILHEKDRIFSHHNEILQALAQAVATETHAGTLYNICEALAKMNLVNPKYYIIPWDQVSNIKLGYTISISSIEFLITQSRKVLLNEYIRYMQNVIKYNVLTNK